MNLVASFSSILPREAERMQEAFWVLIPVISSATDTTATIDNPYIANKLYSSFAYKFETAPISGRSFGPLYAGLFWVYLHNVLYTILYSEVSRHLLQLTTLGDKIDRARSILTLFGDKIDRLKSFLPFWESKIEKKCHFYFLFGYKTGRKRRESRKK